MMSHQELMNQVDMLKGNINRMCVTDDVDELINMYNFAMDRLDMIYNDVREKLNIKNEHWIDMKIKYPEPYTLVKIKFDDGETATDMLIKGKYGNLEWRNYVDDRIVAWKEI